MKGFEPILTDRLYIRKLELSDAQDFFHYRSLPKVYRFQSFQPKSIEDVRDFYGKISDSPSIPNTWFQLAICEKGKNKIIGDIGIHTLGDGYQVEIGYTLNPDYQELEYAQESVMAVIEYLFLKLGIHRVIASVDPDNEKSIRLLEKIGMRKEAHFVKRICVSGVWLDDCIFALRKEEFTNHGIADPKRIG